MVVWAEPSHASHELPTGQYCTREYSPATSWAANLNAKRLDVGEDATMRMQC